MNAISSALPTTPSINVPRAPLNFWKRQYNIIKKAPFILMHLGLISLFFVPVTTTALIICVTLYVVRMFGITAGYHRYFSHRAYKTTRVFQFVLAWIGCASLQRGPLWWAGHHRLHHKHSDTENDVHSPITQGVWWSHVGWILSPADDAATADDVRDLNKFWELRWLDHLHWIPGVTTAALCYWIDGLSGLLWGFLLSTILLYHGTFLVNSVCHIFGKRRYQTTDQSKNNFWVAIVTLGEGWHNNHHHYMSSANQGFFWWEVDISYYTLKVLSLFGIVWDLRKPPANKLVPTIVPNGAATTAVTAN